MKKTITLFSVVCLCFLLFSSFTPDARALSRFNSTMDVFIENNTSDTLTVASFISPVGTQTFPNVSANGGTNSSTFDYDQNSSITIFLYYAVPPVNAVASIYSGDILLGTVNITAGGNSFVIPPPFTSGGLIVIVN